MANRTTRAKTVTLGHAMAITPTMTARTPRKISDVDNDENTFCSLLVGGGNLVCVANAGTDVRGAAPALRAGCERWRARRSSPLACDQEVVAALPDPVRHPGGADDGVVLGPGP